MAVASKKRLLAWNGYMYNLRGLRVHKHSKGWPTYMYIHIYIYTCIGNKVTQIYVLTCSPALSDHFGANLRTGKFCFTAGCSCERGAVCVLFWCFPFLVHRKLNITPENSLPTIIFQKGTLNFGALVSAKAPKIWRGAEWKGMMPSSFTSGNLKITLWKRKSVNDIPPPFGGVPVIQLPSNRAAKIPPWKFERLHLQSTGGGA